MSCRFKGFSAYCPKCRKSHFQVFNMSVCGRWGKDLTGKQSMCYC